MDALLSITYTVCLCAVASSILSVLTPSGGMRRICNAVTGVFLVCIMITAVKSASDFHFEFSPPEISEASPDEAVSEAVVSETEKLLEKESTDYLEMNGVKIRKCEIKLKNSSRFGIIADSVRIYILPEYEESENRIRELIRDYIGTEPLVITEN